MAKLPGRTSVRIMRAVVATLRPRGEPFDADIDEEVLGTALGFLPFLPLPARLGLPLGLRLLEYAPPLLGGGFCRFSNMEPQRAARYLASWGEAGGQRAAMFQGLRALVLISFYQHPAILRALGIDWQGRAEQLTARRAALLGGTSAAGGSQ